MTTHPIFAQLSRFARHSWTVCLLLLPMMVAACAVDEEPPVNDPGATLWTPDEVPGLPMAPREAPLEVCPSGLLDEAGVCMPELPASAQFDDWQCPNGWFTLPALIDEMGYDATAPGAEGFSICAPAAANSARCADGQLRTPNSQRCFDRGLACPEGDWHDAQTLRKLAQGYGGDILYLRPGEDKGEGTREAPFGSLSQALDVAKEGDILALSSGSWRQRIHLNRNVALVGACTSGTTIDPGPFTSSTPAVSIYESGALLTHLTITGENPGIDIQSIPDRVDLSQLHIEGALGYGIRVAHYGDAVHMSEISVAGTHTNIANGYDGYGMIFEDGAQALFKGVQITGSDRSALAARGPETRVFGSDLVATGTGGEKWRGDAGSAISLSDGAWMWLERALLADQTRTGLEVTNLGTRAMVTDLVVDDTWPVDPALETAALKATDGARIVGHRVLVRQTHGSGAVIKGMASSLLLHQAVFDQTSTQDSVWHKTAAIQLDDYAWGDLSQTVITHAGGAGVQVRRHAIAQISDLMVFDGERGGQSDGPRAGLHVELDGAVLLRRASFERALDHGVLIGWGGTASLSDVTITNTQGSPGAGLSVEHGFATVSRAALLNNSTVGVSVAASMGMSALSPEARLILEDALIMETWPAFGTDIGGHGVWATQGGQATLRRVHVFRSWDSGVVIGSLAQAELTDVLVSWSGLDAETSQGDGLFIQGDALVTAERVHAMRNQRYGAVVSRSDVSFTDATFSHNGEEEAGLGSGLVVLDTALVLERFRATDNVLAGIQLGERADLHASHGVIARNLVGVAFDRASAEPVSMEHVLFIDNNVNRALWKLPVSTELLR